MRYILILYFITLLIQNVYGYGFRTHRYLGKIADEYIDKYEENIKKSINIRLESVSEWADHIKRNKKYEWTKQIHYIDIMECTNNIYDENIINKYCEDKCIITGIKTLTRMLKQNKYVYEEIKYEYDNEELYKRLNDEEKLKLLIHLIQDFNQPMHYLGFKRGGNDYKIKMLYNNNNITRNLHQIWDTFLPEYFIKNTNYKGKEDKYIKEDIYTLINRIFNKNIKIACKIYPTMNYLIFNEYYKEEYMKELFDNYMELLIKVLKTIYE
jgi:hypothetical protein